MQFDFYFSIICIIFFHNVAIADAFIFIFACYLLYGRNIHIGGVVCSALGPFITCGIAEIVMSWNLSSVVCRLMSGSGYPLAAQNMMGVIVHDEVYFLWLLVFLKKLLFLIERSYWQCSL